MNDWHVKSLNYIWCDAKLTGILRRRCHHFDTNWEDIAYILEMNLVGNWTVVFFHAALNRWICRIKATVERVLTHKKKVNLNNCSNAEGLFGNRWYFLPEYIFNQNWNFYYMTHNKICHHSHLYDARWRRLFCIKWHLGNHHLNHTFCNSIFTR